jgi:hypothetical protein
VKTFDGNFHRDTKNRIVNCSILAKKFPLFSMQFEELFNSFIVPLRALKSIYPRELGIAQLEELSLTRANTKQKRKKIKTDNAK